MTMSPGKPGAPTAVATEGWGARLVAALDAPSRTLWVSTVVVCAAVSVALTFAGAVGLVTTGPWRWVDLAGGLLTSLAVLVARRAPLPAAVLVMVISCVVTTTAAATTVLQFLVGQRRSAGVTAVVLAGNVVAGVVVHLLRIVDTGPGELVRTALVLPLLWLVPAVCGAALRARGLLLASLRAQAASAHRRAEDRERARIAREMHDVVAHRIALLAMQAGALNRRSQLTEDGLRRGIDDIASTARNALEDLHDVLRVLRRTDDHTTDDPALGGPAGDHARTPERPQPVLADLPELIETMRSAGMAIESRIELPAIAQVPATPGRTIYRVVQEALTNAAKHAPGTVVQLALAESRPRVLRLVVQNRLYTDVRSDVDVDVRSDPGSPTAPAASGPAAIDRVAAGPQVRGSGGGLIGLRERVELAGGTTRCCGIDPGSDPPAFRVEVSVPWTT